MMLPANGIGRKAPPKNVLAILQSTASPEVLSDWYGLQARIAQDQANPLRRAIAAIEGIRPWRQELMAIGGGSTIRGRLRQAVRGVRILVSSMLPSHPLSVEKQANQVAETLRAMKRSLDELDYMPVAKLGFAYGTMSNDKGER